MVPIFRNQRTILTFLAGPKIQIHYHGIEMVDAIISQLPTLANTPREKQVIANDAP